MKPRCPQCDSTWIGYPVPDGAVVVDDGGGHVALASPTTGMFLDLDDVTFRNGKCLEPDCGGTVIV